MYVAAEQFLQLLSFTLMPFSMELLTGVLVPTLEFIRTSDFTNEGTAEKGAGMYGIDQRVEPPLLLPNLRLGSHGMEILCLQLRQKSFRGCIETKMLG